MDPVRATSCNHICVCACFGIPPMFRVNCLPITFEKFLVSALQQWNGLAFSLICLQWKKHKQCVQTHLATSSTISCTTMCSHFFPRHEVAQFNPVYLLHPFAHQYSCFKLSSPVFSTITTTSQCRYNWCSLLANPFYHHNSLTFQCYMFSWFQFAPSPSWVNFFLLTCKATVTLWFVKNLQSPEL